MAAIECIARRLNARQQVLDTSGFGCGARGFGCLFGAEHGPEIRLQGCGGKIGIALGHLHQMAQMAGFQPGSMAGRRAIHVNGHGTVDATAQNCRAKAGMAADLLGHGEGFQAQRAGRL